jgi:hypothetical protein
MCRTDPIPIEKSSELNWDFQLLHNSQSKTPFMPLYNKEKEKNLESFWKIRDCLQRNDTSNKH